MHLRRHRASTTTDSHVPLATNKRSDHEPLGRPVGARPRHPWERVCLLVSEPRLRRSDRPWYSLDFPVVARFTRLQFALAVVIFFVTEVPVIGMTFPLFIAALVFVRTKYLPKKYDARTLELIDPLIDLAPIDKTPSTADLLEEGTPPSSPAPVVVSSPVIRNRAGSA